ncbi:shikimate dehydrogenase [Microbacterium hominis]|uniref:Shikimate dehydrogenase (NADP(+)) n=1 Tax=Microbacterium hominis TaxID=162426 RepID=A0A134DGT3_9MICO|nr:MULTISPECIES: shikimate dehydrogenase [Microbacterium]AUG29015.1 shikimate dehydrogenase [Microbacterium hominis]KXC05741.1 shikimate dehydrogenase [Microbacterium hominis]QOC24877.1 shikimate dehydrogenase [Microbacterium hominis]QOC28929.1 shikimate dehydrogenase [Microbacterium hominis]QRY40470.1 shikimate dehydrogenase [Microbacterium hominis]
MTRSYLVGLIGSGIGSSSTPALHESEADAHGVRYLYRTIDIDALGRTAADGAELVRQAQELGYDALNITHPCKQTVLSALDELSPDAELLGAVNTVVFRDGRAIGANTDHSGFAQGLRDGLDSPALDRVVLLGSGGAGSAIAFALLNAGTRVLSVFDPVVERARAVRTALGPAFPGAEIVAIGADELAAAIGAADGLVNATPIGMVGHPGIPVDPSLLHSGLWVADAIYRPLRTELIETAQALGCAVLDGGRMVVGQAADTFRLITGRDADPERMRARFLALTGATQ